MDPDRILLMTVAFLATYAVQSSIVLTGAYVITRQLGSGSDRLSETILRGALIVPLVSALLSTIVPGDAGNRGTALGAALLDVESNISRAGVEVSWPALALLLWLAGVLLGISQLFRAWKGLRSLTRGREPLGSHELQRMLGDDFAGEIAITSSGALSVPIAFGREVCIPRWAFAALTPTQLQLVVSHETAHVRRHDEAWSWAYAILCRLFFFQPFNWIVSARLRELAECICDEEAVSGSDAPAELAVALGVFAARVSGPHSTGELAPAIISDESLTLRRVRRILSLRSHGALPSPLRRGLALLGIGTSVAALTAFAPRVRSPSAPDVPYTIHAQDPAGEFTLTMDRGRVVHATIGGKKVPSSRVRQDGRRLQLIDDRARALSLELTATGGIRWSARPTAQ